MSITKDSKEWRDALQFAGKWKPNQRCMEQDGFQWCETHNDDGDHNIPPPDITPDLLYAILEVMVTKYRTMQAIDWEMNFEGRSFRDAIIRAAASLVASLVVERD